MRNGLFTEQTLRDFLAAWNAHDIDTLMSFMTDDCIFLSASGSDLDRGRYVGKDAVRNAYAAIWISIPDANWTAVHHSVSGDRGFSEWILTGTRWNGQRVEIRGCDLFTLRGERIQIKDSYRKNIATA